MTELLPLPSQPEGAEFPAKIWPTGQCSDETQTAAKSIFEDPELIGDTHALVVIQGGQLIFEQYGPDQNADSTLISWSMAKSFLGVIIGMLVDDGLLNPQASAPVAEWANDERSEITLEDLLQMRSGLEFIESYTDGDISHCIQMLFGEGEKDVAAYAISRPKQHPRGTVWNYSSGETNIISKIAADALGGPDKLIEYLQTRLLDPLGMISATAQCDAAGTWIASSFLYATARDFARFGLLILRGGKWDSTQLVDERWIDRARTPHATDPERGMMYGEQFWIYPGERGRFGCSGYEGQYIQAIPTSDAVIVRLGKTEAAIRPNLLDRLDKLVATLD